MRIVFIGPHAEPDTAPTGRMLSGIAAGLIERGHEVHIVTSLPWYRHHAVEPAWSGAWWRVERSAGGSITRVHPFPGGDKRNLLRRALGFVAFSALVAVAAVRAGGFMRRVDAVVAMSPPLTLAPAGWFAARLRRARLILNVQDIFPDAAVETGAITDRRIVAAARWFERWCYRRSDAVTVLSAEMASNVQAKVGDASRAVAGRRGSPVRVECIPNFVDTEAIRPADRMTDYRRELGIDQRPVVMYAGNVGFSQSLDLLVAAAQALPDVAVVINGDGSARADLEMRAAEVGNLHVVGYQPVERLAEVLATADVQVVTLRAGLGAVSVPSKVYSILAAGRPVLAAIDEGTEIPRLVASADAGRTVPPDDPDAFIAALTAMLAEPDRLVAAGASGRAWVEASVSVGRVADAYHRLITEIVAGPAAGSR